jgi:hypothetical protein
MTNISKQFMKKRKKCTEFLLFLIFKQTFRINNEIFPNPKKEKCLSTKAFIVVVNRRFLIWN